MILESKKCTQFRKHRIVHYFKRIEFQHRGSPYAHVLLWLENVPLDPIKKDIIQVIELIDKRVFK